MRNKNMLLHSASFVMVVIIVILSGLFVFALDSAYKHVADETVAGFDNNIKVAVETVIGALTANHQQAVDGVISEADAMETAKNIVRDARYSSAPDKNNDGYFWADMADGLCVVHYNPANEGAMRWNAQDLEGNYYIQTFIRNGNAGGDYSDFYFGKPGDESGSHKKRGYTETFKPYGWYISTGNYYEDTDIVLDKFAAQERVWLVVIGVFAVLCIVFVVMLTRWMTKRIYWYENILDNIPSPLSVTDINGNWTFINKPVEAMLGKKRADMIGKQCSNWGAGICNTDNCGMKCIGRGQTTTKFTQAGMDFKVDVAYLTDQKNRKFGHVEIVNDITDIVKSQKAEAQLVKEIEEISRSFYTASAQIADGAQLLSQSATEQAATIQQLSEASNEIAGNTKTNAEIAGKTASLADTIKGNAEKGSRQMSEMIRAVGEINDASQRINRVIKTIDDIAFQTNILALNAAVEAARAGQHGKGFAVVAEEVRNLATKSAAAAKDTAGLIENSIEKAELGTQIANETETSLSEIVSGINESSRLITEMARSSEKQSADIDHMHKGINQMAQIVQQNSATARQEASASEGMREQSAMLDGLIENFKGKESNRALPPGRGK